jgi:guanine nucleotide-binding protein G(I)/G(S)/G(T) subunit beta-1
MTCAYETTENSVVAAGGLDNVCTLYSVSTALGNDKPLQELSHHDGYLACCKFIGPNKILTSSGDATCVLWDIDTGAPEHVLSDHAGDVMTVSVCPTNANVFVSGSCDATAKMWDLRTRTAVHTFIGHESDINTVQWMSNGYAFGSGSDDTQCKIFDTRAHFPVAQFADDSALASIISLDFSQSGRLLFAGNDNSGCVVWDTLGSPVSPVDVLMSHTNRVSSVQTAPSGQAIATASWDTTLIVYA